MLDYNFFLFFFMVESMSAKLLILLLHLTCIVTSPRCFASASPLVCPRQSKPLLVSTIPSHCPLLSFSSNPPVQVNGESLERALASKKGDVYSSVLFYASWCPFSQKARMVFEVLSCIYPEIEHLAVEQSSVMPSLFSRYGIHSVPAIYMVNQTSKLHFHGSKDLNTLMIFYTKTTGYRPLQFITASDFGSKESRRDFIIQSWIGLPAHEILTREPYLVLSLLFLVLRLVIMIYPRVLHYLRALWVSYAPHLKLQIFRETGQIFYHSLHMIDVKRIWTRLRLCKSRNFHQGARSAHVWASSLASVSLGESSAARSSSFGKAF